MKAARIKLKYNPEPSAQERRFHIWLIECFDCACGCGAVSGVVHHPLTRHPDQRWRRDHEFVVPMHGFCHMRLHQHGSEKAFRPDRNFANLASHYRHQGIAEGLLECAA